MINILLSSAHLLSSILGWVGSIAYLLAYILLSIGKLRSDQKAYHLLNVIGAVGLTYHAFLLSDFPNVVVNIAWAIVALGSIVFILQKKRG